MQGKREVEGTRGKNSKRKYSEQKGEKVRKQGKKGWTIKEKNIVLSVQGEKEAHQGLPQQPRGGHTACVLTYSRWQKTHSLMREWTRERDGSSIK